VTGILDRRAEPFEPGAPRPEPAFAVLGVAARARTAVPTLVFELEATDASGLEVYTIALTVQILVEPARRRYDERTRELLAELFGAPDRWSSTTESFLWTQADVLVPSFAGSTRLELPLPCSYDLELAAAKYLYSLPDGEAPLVFHFSGSVFYRGELDRMQVVKVTWSCSAEYRLPVAVWRELMARHYPGGGWIRLRHETIARLQRRKAAAGLRTFDDCVTELLEEAG
jgi:hypothetical protein